MRAAARRTPGVFRVFEEAVRLLDRAQRSAVEEARNHRRRGDRPDVAKEVERIVGIISQVCVSLPLELGGGAKQLGTQRRPPLCPELAEQRPELVGERSPAETVRPRCH